MLANCKICGKLINMNTSKGLMCSDCRKAEDIAYHKVKDYLIDNPNAHADELVVATGVHYDKVRKFWDGGRLKAEAASDHLAGQKLCRGCGTPISIGELCSKCFVARQQSAENNSIVPGQGINQPTSEKRDLSFKKIEKKELKGRMHTRKFGR